jgi:hypothetical protein
VTAHRHPIAATEARPDVPAELRARYGTALTGEEWCVVFGRWAEKLAAEQRASTGRELPGNQGFSVKARPYSQVDGGLL